VSIVCLSLAGLPNSRDVFLFLYLVEGADPETVRVSRVTLFAS
jgi:hypothetical protein